MMLNILEWLLWAVMLLSVGYLFFFALASLFYREPETKEDSTHRKVMTLIPAYRADATILETARSASSQDYPEGMSRVIVISDGMKSETVEALRRIPVEVMEVHFDRSTKAKSLAEAMGSLRKDEADIVAVLDADNIVSPTFLRSINAAFGSGWRAVQLHRTAANTDSSTAMLDAVSEEVNNSIFRKGHAAIGLSSALIGSGMAFDFGWFKDAAPKLSTVGEDKEIELMLLRDGIRVSYIDSETVLDEKTRTESNYASQRRRWMATQITGLSAAFQGKAADMAGFADKVFQWCLLPRMVMTGLLALLTVLFSIIRFHTCGKWWLLVAMFAATMVVATPRRMWSRDLLKAGLKAPRLILIAATNIFRLKGASDTFIHTTHDGRS